MKLTVLGCGPSSGVPLVGNVWGQCDPANPKNARLRTSLLIQDGVKNILIDTSPDLRQQLLRTDVKVVDAILYTHAHSDHAHGIDDLRPIYFGGDHRSIPAYGSTEALEEIQMRFDYIFKQSSSPEIYPPICTPHIVREKFEIFGHKVIPFEQNHGHSLTTGYRFDQFAYSTDVKNLDDNAFDVLKGVEVWFVDCLARNPRPTHAHLDLTLSWIERVKPTRAILIHMNQTLDYETLKSELPKGVEPAYDGMTIEI